MKSLLCVFRRTSRIHITIGCLTLLLNSLTLHAQDEDPLAVEPIDRYKASLPTPYGFVASAANFVYGYQTDDADAKLRIGIDAYYDTWQVGFHREQYGNVFRLMTRSVGRDFASYGFFALAGWRSQDILIDGGYDSEDKPIIINQGSRAKSVYGAGFRYGSGYSGRLSFIWGFETFLTTAGIGMELPLGLRIPMNQHAVQISVIPSLMAYAVDKPASSEEDENEDTAGIIGFWLSAKYAFNLEHE